jgi:hypothetical protein
MQAPTWIREHRKYIIFTFVLKKKIESENILFSSEKNEE